LHPGPLVYAPPSESLLIVSGNYLVSVRYTVLTQMSSAAKKLNVRLFY
jgi:hypothetical protein